jgi:hypothetical protein
MQGGADLPTRAVRAAALAFVAALAVEIAVIIAARIRYPYELEWMTGAILDHVERVRTGAPLYGPPSADWTPYIYPPGYYWVCAWVTRVLPEHLGCRLVSLVASGVVTACVHALARRLGAPRYHALLAAALYVACFGFTLCWYDIERADNLLVAMLAVSAVVLLRSRGTVGAACAGAIVGLAFFVKQPASTFLVAVPVGLVVARQVRRAVAFAAGGAATLVPVYALLQAQTGGWFSYYCVTLPAAHGMPAKYVTTFFVLDVSHGFALTVATAALGAVFARAAWKRVRRVDDGAPPEFLVFGAYVLAGFFASATSRLHIGGWSNVLMFWTAFACPAVAVVAARVEALAVGTPVARPVAMATCALVALQAGSFAPDPFDNVPSAKDARYAAAFEARVREIERGGREVVVLGRGHVTAKRHLHVNALVDVLRGGGEMPADMRDALTGRRWEALVVDEIRGVELEAVTKRRAGLVELIERNYFVAERLDADTTMPVVGFTTVPRWIFRPRRAPLGPMSDAALQRRMYIEAGFAERNMWAAHADARLFTEGLDIESLAAAADAPDAPGSPAPALPP